MADNVGDFPGFARSSERIKHSVASSEGQFPVITGVHAGWVVGFTGDVDALTDEQKALLGQHRQREAALALELKYPTGEADELVAYLPVTAIGELILELLTAFGTREIWKALGTAVPEGWQ